MTAADLFPVLSETTIASSAAIMLVLGLRRWLRNAFGAGVAYAAWALVPLAILAVLLPAAPSPLRILPVMAMEMPSGSRAVSGVDATVGLATWVVIAVACGALACALRLFVQQRRFMQGLGMLIDRGDGVLVAQAREGLPAVVGLWRPRILLPADAMRRYDATERDLMLAHERAHIARGDLLANAGVAALRCLFWFNPLVQFAARCFRHDQELACDQHVVRRHPHARRAYGEAMLKTQLAHGVLPLGCHWVQAHPLRERIEMLKQPVFSLHRRVLGRAVAVALSCTTAYAAWAAQPTDPLAVPASGREALPQGSVDDAPRMKQSPVSPVDVQTGGGSGRVVLLFDVAADGSVAAARVERSSGNARLDAAALAAAKKWKFRPEIKDGEPVPSQVRVPVDFGKGEGAGVDAAKETSESMKDASRRQVTSTAALSATRPITNGQAKAATRGRINTYERMLTSLSASWQPQKPVEEDC